MGNHGSSFKGLCHGGEASQGAGKGGKSQALRPPCRASTPAAKQAGGVGGSHVASPSDASDPGLGTSWEGHLDFSGKKLRTFEGFLTCFSSRHYVLTQREPKFHKVRSTRGHGCGKHAFRAMFRDINLSTYIKGVP